MHCNAFAANSVMQQHNRPFHHWQRVGVMGMHSAVDLFIYLLLRQMAARHIQNSNIHTTQLYKN